MTPGLRIAVHLGYHKTASSWFQTVAFPAHPDLRFYAPMDATGRVGIPPLLRTLVADPDDVFDPERARARLLDEHRDRGAHEVLLVSAERLSGHAIAGGRDAFRIARRLHATFPEARVFWLVRDRADSLASEYGELIREGWTGRPADLRRRAGWWSVPGPDPDYWRYERLATTYLDLFGPDQVRLWWYERFTAQRRAVLEEIAAFLGVRPFPVDAAALDRQVRRSRRPELTRARRLLNGLRRSELAPHAPVLLPSRTLDRVEPVLARVCSNRPLLDIDDRAWASSLAAESDRALVRLGLPAPPNEEEETPSPRANATPRRAPATASPGAPATAAGAPVVVNLGFGGTGTRWLQRHALSAHPDLRLVPAPTATHHGPGTRRGEAAVTRWVVDADPDFDPDEVRDELLGGIGPLADHERVVISSDRLSGHPASGGWDAVVIAERIHATFPAARVFWFLPDRVASIRSAYEELVAGGWAGRPSDLGQPFPSWKTSGPDLRRWEYEHLVEVYQRLFGADSVLVQPFDRLLSDTECVLDRLARFMGVPPFPVDEHILTGAENGATSPSQVRARRMVNHFRRCELNPAPLVEAPSGVAARLERLLGRFASDRPLFDDAEATHLAARFAGSDDELRALGVEPPTDEPALTGGWPTGDLP